MRFLARICAFVFLFFPLTGISALVNESFETGSFHGWTTIGDSTIQTAVYGSGPTDGIYEALITSGAGSVSDAELEQFFGLGSGYLNSISPSALNVINGSAIKQTFTANAGDSLVFDWNFLTGETAGGEGGMNDFGFYVLSAPTVLVDFASSSFVDSGSIFASETGFMRTEIIIPADGTYTFGLGVVNVFDTLFVSGLIIDNVHLTPVPIPASLWLFASGLILIFSGTLRKRFT